MSTLPHQDWCSPPTHSHTLTYRPQWLTAINQTVVFCGTINKKNRSQIVSHVKCRCCFCNIFLVRQKNGFCVCLCVGACARGCMYTGVHVCGCMGVHVGVLCERVWGCVCVCMGVCCLSVCEGVSVCFAISIKSTELWKQIKWTNPCLSADINAYRFYIWWI